MKDVTFVNLTPHAINLNDGTVHPPSGETCSVEQVVSDFDGEGIATSYFKGLALPSAKRKVRYITSMLVAQAAATQGRTDVVSPATRHPETIRDESGHIVSVPGFISFAETPQRYEEE